MNCEAIPNIEVGTPLHFFTNLGKDLVDNNYEKNYCKLSDIHSDENYYYVVLHYCSYNNLFDENEWLLSEEVEYCVKNKNLKVIFLSEHESYMDFGVDVKKLSNLIDKKGLNPKQFYLINNNSLKDLKKSYNSINQSIDQENTRFLKLLNSKVNSKLWGN